MKLRRICLVLCKTHIHPRTHTPNIRSNGKLIISQCLRGCPLNWKFRSLSGIVYVTLHEATEAKVGDLDLVVLPDQTVTSSQVPGKRGVEREREREGEGEGERGRGGRGGEREREREREREGERERERERERGRGGGGGRGRGRGRRGRGGKRERHTTWGVRGEREKREDISIVFCTSVMYATTYILYNRYMYYMVLGSLSTKWAFHQSIKYTYTCRDTHDYEQQSPNTGLVLWTHTCTCTRSLHHFQPVQVNKLQTIF